MKSQRNNNDTEIVSLDEKNVDEVLALFCSSFLDEPLMRHLGISNSDLEVFFAPRLQLALSQGLSLVLLENGRCASAMLNDDFSENYDTMPMPDRLQPVFEFLTHLHPPSLGKEEKLFHFFCGGTLQRSRRKGYLGTLTLAGYELAREKGFQSVVVEATSPYTQKLCRSQGFRTVNSSLCASFPAFEGMGEARVDIMQLEL